LPTPQSRERHRPNGVDAVREPRRAKESFRPETSATASGGRRLRRVLDQYARFFSTGGYGLGGGSGLLFVAVSVVNRDDSQYATRERRTVLAGSAFLALVDIFFVTMVSSFGGTAVLATTSLVMSVVGLLGTSILMPRAARAGNFARGFPKRNLNLAFATVAVAGYSLQLALAVALLMNEDSRGVTRALIFVLVGLFGSALARGWEVAGVGHRGQRAE